MKSLLVWLIATLLSASVVHSRQQTAVDFTMSDSNNNPHQFFSELYAQTTLQWSAPIDVAPRSYSNLHPRIVLDAASNPIILWGNSSTKRAVFSRWTGSSYTLPVTLNPSSIPVFAASWAGPDIASKGDTVYVVFKETPEDTNHIYIIHSFDGGKTFSTPSPVDFIADSISRFPTVTIDESGNPIVAFMKFNPGFKNSRWVVTKSADFGQTFSGEVLASGYSGGEVCDCCPGSIVCVDQRVAMLYRDNLNNIRDSWVGISSTNGSDFNYGIPVDKLKWNFQSCPASGPDGVIVGDTVYSIFMSGAAGRMLVYHNRNSISTMQSSKAVAVTQLYTQLSSQNYPRSASHGTSVAEVWQQDIGGGSQAAILFAADVRNGFPARYDTLTAGKYGSVVNVDVAIGDGAVHVVWEDDASGTIKYRKALFNTSDVDDSQKADALFIHPSITSDRVIIQLRTTEERQESTCTVSDLLGRELFRQRIMQDSDEFVLNLSDVERGIYMVSVTSAKGIRAAAVVRQ